jgi:hypothetical protein
MFSTPACAGYPAMLRIRPRLLSRHIGFTPAALAAFLLLAGCATTGAPPAASTAPSAPATGAAASPAPAAPAAAGAPRANPVSPAPGAAAAAGATPPATAAAARPPAPAPGTPPPFAEVTKDAKRTAGFLPLWTKDERTWIEIPAAQLDKPFYLGTSIAQGLGERFLLPGLMGTERVVMFKRVANNVQLLARNLSVRAADGTPLAQALAESYSDSLLAAAPLAAAPHAESKALLVDASVLLGGDIPGVLTFIESAFRMPYGQDRANSHIERARTSEQATTITMRTHYSVPKLPAPQALPPGAPPPNPAALPSPPRTVPDARSFFLGLSYVLAPLPASPMATRRADQRVGFFTDSFINLAQDDASADRKQHIVQRWRLEKKDPAAAVSEPKEPIRVVMDRNIPERWRHSVRAGILEWNKAFERAGFANALVVEQQPADADWTTTEGHRLLAVRWFAMQGPGGVAVGPSQTDIRTGEILRGAAIIPENWVRFDRSAVRDTQPRLLSTGDTEAETTVQRNALGEFGRRFAQCSFAQDALEHTAFGLELLELRGNVTPDSPEALKYIQDSLKLVVAHEVGHALGLRHNFVASTGITRAQLRDPAFTSTRGTSNSVMDYNPPNIPLQGEVVADYHMTVLGAYDYWAIEYGYREFAAGDEPAALARLGAMSDSDPNLAYATDEDAAIADPSITLFDLGDDPMAFAQRNLLLARELWQRTQARTLPPDDDFTVLRRNLQRGLSRVQQTVPILTRYIGGVESSRALASANKPLHRPVAAARQRAALDVLLKEVFASSNFKLDPGFMMRLGVDLLGRGPGGPGAGNTDYSLPQAVAAIHRSALDQLMSESTAVRLADAEVKVADPKGLLSYAELQQRLRQAVWSEIANKAGNEIDSMRRTLQREHAKRLAGGLVRPSTPATADVRAAHRQEAAQLEAELRAALGNKGWSATARAHIADSQALLAEALRAPLTKQGV